jgi:hypothetical protein
MFAGDQNLHMRNQIQIFGSQVEAEEKRKEAEKLSKMMASSKNNQTPQKSGGANNFKSEYNRTYEEAMKIVQNGEEYKKVE